MLTTRNIFATILSIALGVLTVFIASPKKLIKKKERSTAQSAKREDNLFI